MVRMFVRAHWKPISFQKTRTRNECIWEHYEKLYDRKIF